MKKIIASLVSVPILIIVPLWFVTFSLGVMLFLLGINIKQKESK